MHDSKFKTKLPLHKNNTSNCEEVSCNFSGCCGMDLIKPDADNESDDNPTEEETPLNLTPQLMWLFNSDTGDKETACFALSTFFMH